jgi:hypothetical protein
VVPELGEYRRRRLGRPTLAASAAAAVLILAITAIIVGHANHHNHPVVAQGSGAGSLEPLVGAPLNNTNLTPVSTGRSYNPSNLAAYVPALINGTSATPSATSSGVPVEGSIVSASPGPTHGGSVSSDSTGAGSTTTSKKSTRRASQNLAPLAAPPQFTTHAPVPAALLRFQNSTAALINCAAVITDSPNAIPEAVDFGRWSDPTISPPIRHKPALIMVFADRTTLAAVDVYVVAPSCGPSALLKFQKVALGS